MTPTSPTLSRLADPLSAVTRTERKALLGLSAIGLVVVWTGLIPSKISALGVDFSTTDQRALLRSLAAVVGYFLLAFLSYAANDLVAWRTAFHEAMEARLLKPTVASDLERAEISHHASERLDVVRKARWRMSRIAPPISVFRVVVDFVVPVVVAALSIFLLLKR